MSGFEVEGSPPTGGQVLDVVFIDQAGVWVVPNNDPAVSLLKIPVEEANAYLEIPLADLLFECTTPPCAATMPNVTAAFLERGNFDGIGDDNDDLAVYIQTDANPTGPEGTLVYLKVASGGGLEVMRRHPTIGRDAVDMVVAKFDSDDTDDVALLFDTSIKVVRASGLTPWVQSANLKNTVALAVTDLDQTGDNDLVVLGRGDTTNTTLFWLAWNTGTGLTNPVSFTMRIANDDIVTDIAMERLLSDTNHLVVLITAEQGDEGRLYFYPIVSTVFTPLLPDPAVDSFSGGAKRILLADVGPQTPRRFLDAENLTVPLATDIIVKDGARDVLVLGDGAPFVDEMGAEKNLRVGMLTLFQGPFTEALVTTQSEIAPSFEGFLRVYLESSQWRLASLLDPDVAVPSMPNRNVTGIAIGDFDLTEGPDIVISDAENGELVFLRAQPPPCATYVTLVAHGHLGVESHYPPQLPFPYQENVDLMLSSLSERVQLVNDLRRPGSPTEDDLCAIRHLEVRGHWEEGTRAPLYADPLRPESGQLMVGAARVLWVGSQYGAGGVLLPAHPPATLVGATPTTYGSHFCTA